MFDIAPSEFLLTAIVAIVVIGPKDMPMALRTAGRWIGKMRRMSNHLRSGFETMIREAELEDMEKKWREQNAAIMAAHPTPADTALPGPATADTGSPAMMPLAHAATPHPVTIEQPAMAQAAADLVGADPAADHVPRPVAPQPPLP